MGPTIDVSILKTLDELDEALPGVYVVRSKTPAYFPAMGLIEEGHAELLGELYDEDGLHVVTIGLRTPSEASLSGPADDPGRRTITIGREFFVTALKDYSDWQIKWWREAVQNSVDAGGTTIELGSRNNADDTVLVWCDDNGSGMDEETIINKFLVLGASSKTGAAGQAGGFGKAKELLLLPWISWRIESRGTIVEGAGIDYVVKRATPRVGTRLEVLMPKDRCTDWIMAMNFVERCFLPRVTFTIVNSGGERTVHAQLAGRDLIQSLPGKADVYFTPSDHKQSYAYVRTHGLFMFTRYLGEIPGYVLIELTAPSIEILTANRDGFRDWATGRMLDDLSEKIAKDNMSAINAKRGLIRQKFEGSGKFRAKQLAASLLQQIGPTSGKKLSNADEEGIIEMLKRAKQFEQERAEENPIAALPPSPMVIAMLDQKFLGANHLENAIKQLVWEPDFFLINEVDGFRIPKKFWPATMTPRVLKLMKAWVELCRYVLMQLGSDAHYGVGFIFSETSGAAAVTEKENEGESSWLMLNPYKDANAYKMINDPTLAIWSPSQDSDLKWIYAAAVHECTHIADGLSYHDESFAAALTRNMAKCADGYRKIRQIVGEIRGRGGVEADVDED